MGSNMCNDKWTENWPKELGYGLILQMGCDEVTRHVAAAQFQNRPNNKWAQCSEKLPCHQPR